MALWVAILARLDLQGEKMGRLGIYLLGMVETFNLGRDITFIALYPVIFGLIIVWLIEGRLGLPKQPRVEHWRAIK